MIVIPTLLFSGGLKMRLSVPSIEKSGGDYGRILCDSRISGGVVQPDPSRRTLYNIKCLEL